MGRANPEEEGAGVQESATGMGVIQEAEEVVEDAVESSLGISSK